MKSLILNYIHANDYESFARVLHIVEASRVRYESGLTILHVCALFGRTQMIRFASKSFIDVDPKDDRRNTPLHIAADAGMTESFMELVRLGADLSPMNKFEFTPMMLAGNSLRHDIVAFYLRKGFKFQPAGRFQHPIYRAINAKDVEFIRLLLTQDSPKWLTVSNEDKTPLELALKQGGETYDLICESIRTYERFTKARDECSVCMDEPSTIKIEPCGHRYMCKWCHEKLESLKNEHCPICRGFIVTTSRDFFPVSKSKTKKKKGCIIS